MRYMGSKNKISKYIIPIIQEIIDNNKYENYIEPFVGGANLIDKIKCKNKYGYDIHEELIELLK
jgi:site-specific DNA-adenine methylase